MKSLILLLIAMSAAGTFPFIIYIALSTIFDNYISARFRNGDVVISLTGKNRSDIYWILFKFRGIFTENIYRIMDLFLKYNNFL